MFRGAWRRSGLEPVLEDGGDALVIERADLDRAGGDRLRSGGINAPIETQDAKACAEPLLRMWPSGNTVMISASVLDRSPAPGSGSVPGRLA